MGAEPPANGPDPRWLIGRSSEYHELVGLLRERPGLVVIAADPLSGASGVLIHAEATLEQPAALVDARGTADALDLAMRIAEAAIGTWANELAGWWESEAAPHDRDALRALRALSQAGVEADELRVGRGDGLSALRHALRLAVVLAGATPLIILDHLDVLLEALGAGAAVELLGVLRAERQTEAAAELVLVGRPDGPLVRALEDARHPLYRAGQMVAIRRATQRRFAEEIRRSNDLDALAARVATAAVDLTSAAPGWTWRVVDLAEERDGGTQQQAAAAWARLRHVTAPEVAARFDLLSTEHRIAPTVVALLANGLAPYSAPVNDKTVHETLNKLRRRGVVWSPEKGAWRVADPLLMAWAREHAPPWVRRQAHRRPG